MLLYMALAPEAKLTYKEGGPAAAAAFEAGVAGIEASSFRGCGVFTSEPVRSMQQLKPRPRSFCIPDVVLTRAPPFAQFEVSDGARHAIRTTILRLLPFKW